jgi:hypothetical protein
MVDETFMSACDIVGVNQTVNEPIAKDTCKVYSNEYYKDRKNKVKLFFPTLSLQNMQ